MNILPFVITILLILGMFSLTQLKQIRSPETKIYISYFETLRQTRNALAHEVYQKEMKKQSKNNASSTGNQKSNNEDVPYFRDQYFGCKEGRLNLYSLLEEKQNSLLKEVATAYLRTLYGHLPDYSDALLDDLLEAQAAYIAANHEPVPFYELTFKDPKKHEKYYRFIRGTNTYDLKTKGFPPLEDFFTFNADQKKPMLFNYAPEVFLNVVFSTEFTAEIRKEEHEAQKQDNKRTSCFNREGLLIKANEKMISDANSKMDLFEFKSKRAKKTISTTDEKTGITVRARVLSESSK